MTVLDVLLFLFWGFLCGYITAQLIEKRRQDELYTHFQSIINSLDEELSSLKMDLDELEENLQESSFSCA